MTVRQPFQESSSVGQMKLPAALQTSISSPPFSSANSSIAFLMPSGSRTSPVRQATSIPSSALNCSEALTRFSSLRLTMPTLAPSRPSIRTMYRPIPVAPPVTTALLPAKISGAKFIATPASCFSLFSDLIYSGTGTLNMPTARNLLPERASLP